MKASFRIAYFVLMLPTALLTGCVLEPTIPGLEPNLRTLRARQVPDGYEGLF